EVTYINAGKARQQCQQVPGSLISHTDSVRIGIRRQLKEAAWSVAANPNISRFLLKHSDPCLSHRCCPRNRDNAPGRILLPVSTVKAEEVENVGIAGSNQLQLQ